MAITFGCPNCHNTLRVGDNLGGKRCKCPGCGQILGIPDPDGIGSPVAAPVRAAPVEGPRRKARFDDDLDERPGRRGQDLDREPPPGDHEDFVPRKRRQQSRRRGGSGAGLWIGISAGALLLLVGAGFLLWFLLGGSGVESDVYAYFPDYFTDVECRDLDAIRQSGFYAKAGVNEDSKVWGGIETRELSRQITVSNKSGDTVDILELRSAANPDSIKSNLGQKFKKSDIGGKTVYLPENDKDSRSTAFVVDGKRVVYGNSKSVSAVLKRKGKPMCSPEMQAAVDSASFRGGVTRISKDSMGLASGDVQSTVMQMRFGLSEVSVKAMMHFRDAEAASDAYAEMKTRVAILKEFRQEGSDVFRSIDVSQSGKTVTVTMSIDANLIDKDLQGFPFRRR